MTEFEQVKAMLVRAKHEHAVDTDLEHWQSMYGKTQTVAHTLVIRDTYAETAWLFNEDQQLIRVYNYEH